MFDKACAKNELNSGYVRLRLRNSVQVLVLGPPPVYQDLSTRHDWPVKKAIVDLPIRMKGNSKRWGPRRGISALLRRRY